MEFQKIPQAVFGDNCMVEQTRSQMRDIVIKPSDKGSTFLSGQLTYE